MARAYAYAFDGGPYPPELSLFFAAQEFGVETVFGRRQLSAREIRDLMTAKSANTIIQWYESRMRAGDIAQWAKDHPQETSALELAHKEYLNWQETKSRSS